MRECVSTTMMMMMMMMMMMADDVTIARVQSNANVNSVCAICEQAWLVANM